MRLSLVSRSLLLGFAVFAAPALAVDDPPAKQEVPDAQLEVRVVTTSGGRFSGLVPLDGTVGKALAETDRVEGKKLPKDLSFRLGEVNGATGSMGLHQKEVVSIEKVGVIDGATVGERRNRITIARQQSWEKERARLAQVALDRAVRARQDAEASAAAEAAAAEAALKLPPDLQQWIDAYPPADGWVPAMKQQIYHQTIILNNRPPTEQEKQWLEDYDQWKVAYDAWRDIENAKTALEEKAKVEGKPVPTGDDRSEPSGTALSAGGSIDPAAPPPAEAAILPPKLKPDVKAPVAIRKDIPQPAGLKPDVEAPTDLKNGTQPR